MISLKPITAIAAATAAVYSTVEGVQALRMDVEDIREYAPYIARCLKAKQIGPFVEDVGPFSRRGNFPLRAKRALMKRYKSYERKKFARKMLRGLRGELG